MENTVGDFLRSRRSRIQPEEVGLPAHGRRRVQGLRREEVAQLAGVSVDYYVRLEQGRGGSASDAVLDAVARVLRLDEVEAAHLRALARPPRRADGGPGRRQVRDGTRLLLDLMPGVPAFVLGRRMDVLAWNALGDAVNGFSARPAGEVNAARHTFLDPAAREFYPQWEAVAAETVSYLRLDAGRYPEDPKLAALVGELSVRSEEFRRLWADHQVREKTHGTKLIHHPLVGELDFGYETLAVNGAADQLLVAYTAPAGSPTAERLALLASWRADGGQAVGTRVVGTQDGAARAGAARAGAARTEGAGAPGGPAAD
ncbi:helix-turn-helix transcriptional regulator [Kitasatospora sp. NPDC090091]|uniref:helix-turn-helix transcriptional regulator n=1 Tax=Kitasatospora sp. NPDC090091 TaxID=3364081 RepID=UPI00382E2DFD